MSAEKNGHKIVVEIKSFIGKAFTTEFYLALGQSIAYKGLLQEREPERALYLAVPKNIYKNQFDSPLVTLAVKNSNLKYVVYDIQEACVLTWLN